MKSFLLGAERIRLVRHAQGGQVIHQSPALLVNLHARDAFDVVFYEGEDDPGQDARCAANSTLNREQIPNLHGLALRLAGNFNPV